MSYEVCVDSFSRTEWEACASVFLDYSIYQTWPYQQVRAQRDHQQISRIIIKNSDGRPVLMGQLRIKKVPVLGLRIGYIQNGPLMRGETDQLTCSSEILALLQKAYLGSRIDVLRIMPNLPAEPYGQTLLPMLQQCGFRKNEKDTAYHTFILDVANPGELRAVLNKSFRRDLKKAEQQIDAIREASADEFSSLLKTLYMGLKNRKGFKGLDPEEFILSQSELSESEKMHLLILEKKSEPIMAHLSSWHGDTCIALLAAGNDTALQCGAAYVAWYEAGVRAGKAGMKKYDLGGIDPRNNPGVYQFKLRMNGYDCRHVGSFDAVINGCKRHVWKCIETIHRLRRK